MCNMSKVVDAWENARLEYQRRYVEHLKEHSETKSEYARGHLNECSYVLINVFGVTSKQIKEIERNFGLTDVDFESLYL